MAWAVPGSGGGALTVAGVPGVSVDGSGDAPGDGTAAGRVASFGAPTTLSVLDAASIRIMCWRSCSSRATDRLAGMPATTSAAGHHECRRVAAAGVRPCHIGSGAGPCGSGHQDGRHEQEYTGPRALARLGRAGLPVS